MGRSLRASRGSGGVQNRNYTGRSNFFKNIAGGIAGFEGNGNHFAAVGFDLFAAHNRACAPIGAFYQHIGKQRGDQFARRGFVKNHHEVHGCQGRQDLGTFPFAYDGPSWSFQCANAGVTINADHQEVAQRTAAVEGANVPRMQQIETAVGEDNAARAARFAAHSLHKFCS